MLVCRSWSSACAGALYSRPFVCGRSQVYELLRSLKTNPHLARLVRRPTLMFLSPTVLPAIAPRVRHWWQRPRSIAVEQLLANLVATLCDCASLEGVTYFSRQANRRYGFPNKLLDASYLPSFLTIAGCMLEAFNFTNSSGLDLSNVTELQITACGLSSSLPTLPNLHTLRLAGVYYEDSTVQLFEVSHPPSNITNMELCYTTDPVASAAMDVASRQANLTSLTLIGDSKHLSAPFGSFLNQVKRRRSVLSKLMVSCRAFTEQSSRERLPGGLKTLTILRLPSAELSDFPKLANCLQGSSLGLLEKVVIEGAISTFMTEDADTVGLGRIETWCHDKQVRLTLQQLPGERRCRFWYAARANERVENYTERKWYNDHVLCPRWRRYAPRQS